MADTLPHADLVALVDAITDPFDHAIIAATARLFGARAAHMRDQAACLGDRGTARNLLGKAQLYDACAASADSLLPVPLRPLSSVAVRIPPIATSTL